MKKLLAAIMMLSLIIGLSACGNSTSTSSNSTNGSQSTASTTPDAAAIVKSTCSTCHGQNLEGMVGPKLSDVGSRLTKEQIADIIKNGKTGTAGAMPAGLLTDQQKIDAVAAYLAAKK